jgi:hypothetical protein
MRELRRSDNFTMRTFSREKDVNMRIWNTWKGEMESTNRRCG